MKKKLTGNVPYRPLFWVSSQINFRDARTVLYVNVKFLKSKKRFETLFYMLRNRPKEIAGFQKIMKYLENTFFLCCIKCDRVE